MADPSSKLFSALLKYWRGKRGLSQLDLSLAAGISARHVSYLETGRSAPSEEMVMLLAATLDLPLRTRNDLLRAADFEAHFAEPPLGALTDPGVARTLDRMLRVQEPYPLMILDRRYDVLRMNDGARRLIELGLGAVPERLNGVRILFEPGPVRSVIVNWPDVARSVIWRLERECLHRPGDTALGALLDEVRSAPGVPEDWRVPDLSRRAPAVFSLRFDLGEVKFGFLLTMMRFQAPQNITLEELQIEGWFPLDDETERVWPALMQAGA